MNSSMSLETKSKAERGMLQVQHGKRSWATGFLVGERFVLTNAHCLPRMPDPLNAGNDVVYVGLRRARGERPAALAAVVYCDPVSDLAVLEGPDDQARPEESMHFTRFVGALESLPLRTKVLDRLSQFPVHVRNVKGAWLSGEASVAGMGGRTLAVNLHDKSARIPGGTSGSPVFDDRGRVVGVLKVGSLNSAEYYALALPDHLPFWLLDLIENGVQFPVRKALVAKKCILPGN